MKFIAICIYYNHNLKRKNLDIENGLRRILVRSTLQFLTPKVQEAVRKWLLFITVPFRKLFMKLKLKGTRPQNLEILLIKFTIKIVLITELKHIYFIHNRIPVKVVISVIMPTGPITNLLSAPDDGKK